MSSFKRAVEGGNGPQPRLSVGVLFVILIVLCAEEFLNFGDWTHVQGVFNVADVGNFLVWLGSGVFLVRHGLPPVTRNPISVLMVVYMGFVLVQVGLASLYYGQDIATGFVGVRHQFYFMSFFLFLWLLDTPERIRMALNGLTIVAFVALALGVANYVGPPFLSHKWAEGQRERAGMIRAYIPAMNTIGLAAIWQMTRWVERREKGMLPGVFSLFLFAAHVFRQTRMQLFGVFGVGLGLLVVRRRFGYVALVAVLALVGAVVAQILLPENILLAPFETAAENVAEGSGSWRGRLVQLETDWEIFKRHPLFGSGASGLRVEAEQGVTTTSQAELEAIAYRADLGYSHWLKAYGVVGGVWLLAFMSVLWVKGRREAVSEQADLREIGLFGSAYLVFVAGTSITQNHWMFPRGIVLVCLTAAIIARVDDMLLEKEKTPAPKQGRNSDSDAISPPVSGNSGAAVFRSVILGRPRLQEDKRAADGRPINRQRNSAE